MSLRDALTSFARAYPLIGRPLVLARVTGAVLASIPGYVLAWRRYQQLPGAERLRLRDANPRLSDRLPTSPYDPHYFHQAIWAGERIFKTDPPEHVDIGSQLLFVGMLAARMPVTFVDIRPLELTVAQLRSVAGDILALPFPNQSVTSLSCLHVAEHVGLGRYGDELNPHGTRQALAELQRVLAPGGSLFLSLPIGRPRVAFNAHRVHDPRDIVAWMDAVELAEFTAVDDDGHLHLNASLAEAATLQYGAGMFWFRGRS
jgi:SAM-dependent methyltransferase